MRRLTALGVLQFDAQNSQPIVGLEFCRKASIGGGIEHQARLKESLRFGIAAGAKTETFPSRL